MLEDKTNTFLEFQLKRIVFASILFNNVFLKMPQFFLRISTLVLIPHSFTTTDGKTMEDVERLICTPYRPSCSLSYVKRSQIALVLKTVFSPRLNTVYQVVD